MKICPICAKEIKDVSKSRKYHTWCSNEAKRFYKMSYNSLDNLNKLNELFNKEVK